MAMNRWHSLTRRVYLLLILALLTSLIPHHTPAQIHGTSFASSSIPPDYVDNLLEISDNLVLNHDGSLSFAHPKVHPIQIQSDPSELSSDSGQDFRSAQFANSLSHETPQIPSISTPIRGISLEQSFRVFLPLIVRESTIPDDPDTPPNIGEKPLFNVIPPEAQALATDLNFSPEQIDQVYEIVQNELNARTALDAEASRIINDETLTPTEKRTELDAIDYDGRLQDILAHSATRLRQKLGDTAYAELNTWMTHQWELLIAQRRAIRSTDNIPQLVPTLALTQTNTMSETCRTFTVYANRSTYTDYSADLPDQYIKLANRGITYTLGYTNTTIYSLTVQLNTEIARYVVITDVGPFNHDDNYWNAITDTLHPRRLFTDLPWGMPEAEAAYFDNYNGGLNQFGQIVTSPAGLNVSQQVADTLGMAGGAWVDVTYPWGCIPVEQEKQSRIERSWSTEAIWNRQTAQLVNPVTGNQSMWFRDLRVPAPGLSVDIVRYYNSQDGGNSIFGRGWSSEYDMQVYPQSDGSYKVRYKDGSRGIFRPDSNGGFVGDTGIFDTFEETGNGFALTTVDRTTYYFSGDGRLLRISDLDGNQITLTYTGDNPTTITDPVGRTFSLSFNDEGYVTQIVDPQGRTVAYSYGPTVEGPAVLGLSAFDPNAPVLTSQGALLSGVTNPNGGTTSYGYDPNTLALAQATDPDGITFVQNLYDAQGRVRAQRNAEGKTGSFEYDLENLRATFTDNLGNQTIYIYDKQFRVVQEIDALGNSVYFTYDNNDNLIEKTDKRGNTWKYAYDDRGNLIRREDPIDQYSKGYYAQDVTTWIYNDRNLVTQMTDPLGGVTRYEYDDRDNPVKVIQPDGSITTSTFDSKGQMLSLTDAEGRTSTFEYDDQGNRTKIVDPAGGVTHITYDDAGRVLSQTDAEGNTTQYTYDGNGNVTKLVDALGREIRREYNSNNLLTKQIDRRGAVYEFTYDDNLNQKEVKDPLGNVVTYEYDAMFNRTKMTDARGGVTTYEYDALYRIVKMADPLGYETHYTYDENGNLLSAVDAMGGVTRFVYDALNRRKFVYDALGQQMELCYDQMDRVTRIFDPRRALTRLEYDTVGNLARTIDPLGAVTAYHYDRVRNPVAITDAKGNISTVIYDSLNRPTAQTDGLGSTTRTTYDRVGNVISMTDPNGNTTAFEYNDNYWLTSSTNALGKLVVMAYDEEGNPVSTTDEAGHTTTTTYDLRGLPIAMTDALGHTTLISYDANQNQTSITDANGRVSRYAYDARNILISETDPLGNQTHYAYDGLNRLITATDANSTTTTYTYNAISQLIETTDAKNQTYRYAYDPVGNTTVVTDSNGIATHFEYNFLNQLVREINPLSKTWEYHYDLVGNLVMQVDGKWQAIHYDYDAANRLIRTRYPDGKSIEYEYDAAGNQTRMTDWNGDLRQTYDALHRPVTATDHAGRQIRYAYDDVSNPASITYPDAKVVTYDYNARYELEEMTDPAGLVTRYSYDAVGLLLSEETPNNIRVDLTYDAANRLTSLRNAKSSGETIAQFDFTLDPIGNRTRLVEQRDGAPPTTYNYEYDATYQLRRVISDDGQDMAYAYDPAGNRTLVQGVPRPEPAVAPTTPISVTYDYNDMNAMLRAGNTTYTYDDNGNRIRAVTPLTETEYATSGLSGTLITDYTYDAANRIVAVRETLSYLTASAPDSIYYADRVMMEADYSYDGMGRRIAKLVQTYNLAGIISDVLLREYVYDGLDVVTEYDYHNGAATPNVTNYYYANGAKVAMEKISAQGSSKKYWYTYDALGSVAALTNESGLAVAEYHHDEFGRLIVGDSLLNHYLFTGQEYDEETGLIHFFARYYDSDTGAWMSQDVERGDPMLSSTWHRYMYVLNNPINMTDPLGYWPDWGGMWNSATETVSNAVNAVSNAVSDAVNGISDTASSVLSHVSETAKDLYHDVSKTASDFVNDIRENPSEAWGNFKQNVLTTASNLGENIANLEQDARQALAKAADWTQKHKDVVMIGASVIAGAALCGASLGIGCVAGVALVAGGVQTFANAFDSSSSTGLFDNVAETMFSSAVGTVAGFGIGKAIGFTAGKLASKVSNKAIDAANPFKKNVAIFGNPQKTRGTFNHDGYSVGKANKLIEEGYNKIHYNQSLSTITGSKVKDLRRPDVVGIKTNKDGEVIRFHLSEIVSPSQTLKSQWVKLEDMANRLNKSGFKNVTYSVE